MEFVKGFSLSVNPEFDAFQPKWCPSRPFYIELNFTVLAIRVLQNLLQNVLQSAIAERAWVVEQVTSPDSFIGSPPAHACVLQVRTCLRLLEIT
jgi:hypothetical protein